MHPTTLLYIVQAYLIVSSKRKNTGKHPWKTNERIDELNQYNLAFIFFRNSRRKLTMYCRTTPMPESLNIWPVACQQWNKPCKNNSVLAYFFVLFRVIFYGKRINIIKHGADPEIDKKGLGLIDLRGTRSSNIQWFSVYDFRPKYSVIFVSHGVT